MKAWRGSRVRKVDRFESPFGQDLPKAHHHLERRGRETASETSFGILVPEIPSTTTAAAEE